MPVIKDILVVTTSSIEGISVEKYLKPVAAHVVAGTGFISDFMGGLSDVFGGRSQAYQKQLSSIYEEVIQRIKISAYEAGANCILGLKIDMDEVSGKGKSMFMVTAVGTAAVIVKPIRETSLLSKGNPVENIGIDKVNALRKKKQIIEKAAGGELILDEENWSFVTTNQVSEIFPFLLQKLRNAIDSEQNAPGSYARYYKQMVAYIDALPEDTKLDLLYSRLSTEQSNEIARVVASIINDLNLFDVEKCLRLLEHEDFKIRKRGVTILAFDKSFYNKGDIKSLERLRENVSTNFPDLGKLSTKKGLLSSKEKEVWICTCGKTNDIGTYCSTCKTDIKGFEEKEIKPHVAEEHLSNTIELISDYLD